MGGINPPGLRLAGRNALNEGAFGLRPSLGGGADLVLPLSDTGFKTCCIYQVVGEERQSFESF
jgi:hypothetical protein